MYLYRRSYRYITGIHCYYIIFRQNVDIKERKAYTKFRILNTFTKMYQKLLFKNGSLNVINNIQFQLSR